MDQGVGRPGFCSSERSRTAVHRKNRGAEQRRCSEPEPADSLRDKSNVIGGWLPSLTFAFGGERTPGCLNRRQRRARSRTRSSVCSVSSCGIGSLRSIARLTRIFLSVPSRAICGFILWAVARPAVTADPERLGRRFL